MAITLKGLNKDILNDLRRLGLDASVIDQIDSVGAPGRDLSWVPLKVFADGGVTGFIAYVAGEDGDGYYVILLTVAAGNDDSVDPDEAIDDLCRSVFDDPRVALTLCGN